MAIVVGENSYVTESELTAYATDRGETITSSAEVLLIKAMDWLELQSYRYSKTDVDQPLQFPRNGETEVPAKIKTAQIILALLVDSGEELFGVIGPALKSERIEGAIDREYKDSGSSVSRYPQLENLLSEFLKSPGMNIRIVR